MAEWKNFNINKSQVEYDTGRAYLVKMPHNSNYDGYKFWIGGKLVHEGRHGGALRLGVLDDMEFKLFKNGNGRYNQRDIIAETTISGAELVKQFGVTDANISGKQYHEHEEIEEKAPEVHIGDVVVPEDLQQ